MLYQIGLSIEGSHPVFIVDGATVAKIGDNYIIDSNGKKWKTQFKKYMETYKIGDSVIVTHVCGTAKNGPTLHNLAYTKKVNQYDLNNA